MHHVAWDPSTVNEFVSVGTEGIAFPGLLNCAGCGKWGVVWDRTVGASVVGSGMVYKKGVRQWCDVVVGGSRGVWGGVPGEMHRHTKDRKLAWRRC